MTSWDKKELLPTRSLEVRDIKICRQSRIHLHQRRDLPFFDVQSRLKLCPQVFLILTRAQQPCALLTQCLELH